MTDDDGRDEVPGLPEGGWVGADSDERDDEATSCLNCGMCEWCVERSIAAAGDLSDDTPLPYPVCPSCGAAVGADVCGCEEGDR